MLPPNFEKFDSILNSVAITIGMAFVGTAGAFLIAIPLSFLVSKNTRVGNISAQSLNVIATVTRSIPDIVFALIILRLIGLGPLAGALAIMIGSTGSLARLLANAIDQNDNLSRMSLLSLGAGRATASIVATLREVFPSFLSIVVYRLEINVKTSTILGVVGAGGVGSLLRTSLLQFDFQRAAAISVALVVTIYILEVLSTVARYLLVGQKALNQSKTTNKLFQNLNPRILKTALSVALIALAVLGCLLSVKYVLSSFEFKERNLEDFFLVLVQLSAPDFVSSGWGLFGDMLQTVEIAFLATFIGAVIGIPFAFFAAWNISPNKFIYFISRSLMTIIRGMPNVMFALLFVVAAGLGPVAGVFAMSLSSFGLCSKLVADSLEMALPEPRLALIAGGASRVQEFISATFPQVKFQIMGNLLFALDINVRQATLLGLVGAGGIGYALIESAHNFQFGTLSAIVILIVVTVLAIEYFSKYLQKAARRNQLL
jgi:phosphonate transport system permease protein